MIPTITAFCHSPDGGEGQARDMRVRWALEEVGQPYSVRLMTFKALKEPAHRAIQPFGSIPTYEEGDLALFESGAIVLHVAEHSPGLLPGDANARSRAVALLFAALNTVEPPIVSREEFMLLERDRPWLNDRLPLLDEQVRHRLRDLANRLGDDEWLENNFSAADLMMVMVVRRLEDGTGLLAEFPSLAAYVARGEGRPAYERAFAAQLAVARENHPA